MQSCNPGAIEEHTAGEYRTRTRQDNGLTIVQWAIISYPIANYSTNKSVSQHSNLFISYLSIPLHEALPVLLAVLHHTKASNTRPLKGGTPRIQKDHHRHLFLAALPSFTQDSHAITTISMQSSILQQSPCNSWTKPPGNIELGEHWEGIIVGRLLINPKSKHSFKEWTETREWK